LDLPTFLGVGATLAVVTLLAAFVPGRRATSIPPAVALRGD
jgi:ABC-type lipoprotein release transport system permease subunit